MAVAAFSTRADIDYASDSDDDDSSTTSGSSLDEEIPVDELARMYEFKLMQTIQSAALLSEHLCIQLAQIGISPSDTRMDRARSCSEQLLTLLAHFDVSTFEPPADLLAEARAAPQLRPSTPRGDAKAPPPRPPRTPRKGSLDGAEAELAPGAVAGGGSARGPPKRRLRTSKSAAALSDAGQGKKRSSTVTLDEVRKASVNSVEGGGEVGARPKTMAAVGATSRLKELEDRKAKTVSYRSKRRGNLFTLGGTAAGESGWGYFADEVGDNGTAIGELTFESIAAALGEVVPIADHSDGNPRLVTPTAADPPATSDGGGSGGDGVSSTPGRSDDAVVTTGTHDAPADASASTSGRSSKRMSFAGVTRRQLRDSALFAGDALYDGTLERPSGPPLEGPLSKRSEKGLIKSMKKRYFRLDPEKLHLIYYKNQKEAYGGKMRGFIALGDIIELVANQESANGPYRFTLITALRIYELEARTEDDRRKWVAGLIEWMDAVAVTPSADNPAPITRSATLTPSAEASMRKSKSSSNVGSVRMVA